MRCAQCQEHLRGQIKEPGEMEIHEQNAMQKGMLGDGEVALTGDLQTDDGVAQQKQ